VVACWVACVVEGTAVRGNGTPEGLHEMAFVLAKPGCDLPGDLSADLSGDLSGVGDP
jgi:hypothetical protein